MIAVWWLAPLVLAAPHDTAPPARIELAHVYQLARARNPRAGAARALATATRARVSAARLPPDPELQLGFMNYTLPDLTPMGAIGMTQLQLMQTIPTAGKLRQSARSAAAEAGVASERAQDVEWVLRSQVATAFYTLYATDQGLAVARQTLRLLQDIRAVAEAMYRVGAGRQTDVLRAQVEIARMIEDTLRMTTMRTGTAARLNALLNLPVEAMLGSPTLPVFPDSLPDLDFLRTAAQQERPMVRAAKRGVDAASARQTLAWREIWPDVKVGVQYGRLGGTMDGETERMGSLMLGASIPVFARSRQLRMREEAGAMRLMAEAELQEVRAVTGADVTEAYAGLSRARRLIGLYRTTIIPQAEAAVASALAAYRVGTVDFMTFLDARMSVNKYRQDLFVLEAEQGEHWAELEMLTGRQLFDPSTAARVESAPGGNRQ